MSSIETKTADLSDAEFRAFILILAEANEQRAQDHENVITVARSRLASLAPNRRDSCVTATRVVRELCTKQAWEMQENDATVTIFIRNWSEFQGFAPTELQRNSNQTPCTTTTPNTTTTPSKRSPPTPQGGRTEQEGIVTKLRDLWNEIAIPSGWIPWIVPKKATKTDAALNAKARAFIADVPLDEIREWLEGARDHPHLRGENDRRWKADPDWFFTAKAQRKLRNGSWRWDGKRESNSGGNARGAKAAGAGSGGTANPGGGTVVKPVKNFLDRTDAVIRERRGLAPRGEPGAGDV